MKLLSLALITLILVLITIQSTRAKFVKHTSLPTNSIQTGTWEKTPDLASPTASASALP